MSDLFRTLSVNIVDTIPMPLLTLDANLRIVAANQPFYQTFKISPQETEFHFIDALGSGRWNLPQLRIALKRIITDNAVVENLEITSEFPRIGERTLLFNATRLKVEPSEDSQILLSIQDITEYRRVQEALYGSERRYRDVFEASHDVILLIDAQGNILDINQRAEALTGYSRDELCSMNTFQHLYVPEDVPKMHEVLDAVMMGQKREYEVRWRTKDGDIIYFSGGSAPRFSPDGKFISTICTNHNVTERLRVQEAMRRNEKRFRALLENSLDGIILSDADGVMLYLSPAITRIFGYSSDDLLLKNRFDFIHPEDVEQLKQEWAALVQEPNRIITSEYRAQHKDGTYRWLECISQNLLTDPAVEAIVGNFRDITERKKAEEEMLRAELLRAKLEQEQELIELRERFISMVSHDFRTPLTIIQASTDLIGNYYERLTPEKRNRIRHDIEVQIKYMVELLEEVLMVDRAHTKKLKVELHPLDVVSFCRELLEQLQITDTSGHRFVFKSQSDMKLIQTDEGLLRRILVNLLSNAIKYSPGGGEVSLALSFTENEMGLRISDQGIGIPAGDQDRLFEVFHRASNTGKIKGTGLGLAIVKASVEALGGTITCESEEGQGTTFSVRLPMQLRASDTA